MSARPLTHHPEGAPTRVTRALADELRMILDNRGTQNEQSLVSDFVVRHRLTHRDVDALVARLAHDDVTDAPTTTASSSADGDPSADEPVATTPMATSVEPDGTADEADPTDDDLAWMFGEELVSPTSRGADAIVGRALDDLLGDWSRTGGQLSHAEVSLLVTRRHLSPAQHSELLDLLSEAGIDLPDPADLRPSRAAPRGYELQRESVGQYLHTISRYPLIDAAREVELWSLISQGLVAQEELDAAGDGVLAPSVRQTLRTRAMAGRRAHAELVCANLRLVVSIARARRYEGGGVEFADRIQDGNLGLMRAADKFDGSKGFKFSTYATWWIKQAIERGIGDRGRTIRLPIYLHDQVRKVRKAVSKLSARLDREPTLVEVSDATGLEPGEVQAALDLGQPCRSLDVLFGDDGDLRLSDLLVRDEDRDGRADPAEIAIHAVFRRDLTSTLTKLLPERAVHVVERRFGLGTGDEETLDDIGADYGVTRERIRQIQVKSLATLRESKRVTALQSYLIDDSKAGLSGRCVERKAS
ncbi:MAG: sigma-70 family RNA polymerase sigma factor [Dactylosporangium sp.]|nr:sigma-70 family RNA polymerase sigma factor [Dactylosporangium sp.]NNJ59884.1 sigma-70 family RNA polymerase sigma factor [Dactylosporangium sp.]